ncbi:MAG TPA: DUF952 domain-containing protein [Micropepsaceae bacterium]|nr:DUF952 domain-containing protein [Micropepsaceae bacterium]
MADQICLCVNMAAAIIPASVPDGKKYLFLSAPGRKAVTPTHIFKIAPKDAWESARQSRAWPGSADDQRDGFIHFSTAAQLEGTLARHFRGREGLIMARFAVAEFGPELRWEPARGGALFPHLYALLDPARADCETLLQISADGTHLLPDWARE